MSKLVAIVRLYANEEDYEDNYIGASTPFYGDENIGDAYEFAHECLIEDDIPVVTVTDSEDRTIVLRKHDK